MIFSIVRFPIQIREALALVIVFASYWMQIKGEAIQFGRTWRLLSWGVAFFAANIHISGAILLFIRILSTFLTTFDQNSRSGLMRFGAILSVIIFLGLVLQGRIINDLSALAFEISGDRDIAASGFDTASIVYWSIHAWILYVLYRAQQKPNPNSPWLPTSLHNQAALITGPVSLIIFLNIIFLKGFSASPVVIVLFVRIIDFLISFSIIYCTIFSMHRLLPLAMLLTTLLIFNNLRAVLFG